MEIDIKNLKKFKYRFDSTYKNRIDEYEKICTRYIKPELISYFNEIGIANKLDNIIIYIIINNNNLTCVDFIICDRNNYRYMNGLIYCGGKSCFVNIFNNIDSEFKHICIDKHSL